MKRLLITGASGFLGWNLCRTAVVHFGKSTEIIGLAHSHLFEIPHVKVMSADIRDHRRLESLLSTIRPQAILHTAAISQPNDCQEDPEGSVELNVGVPVFLAQWCSTHEVSFVFTSTDQVFDGAHAPYTEDSPLYPVNVYGEQKAAAEKAILQIHPQSAVCRLPLMFGDPGPAGKSFMQPWVDSLQKGRELRLFTDEFRTPVDAGSASKGLLLALEKAQGIIHLGGRERISRYNFGMLLAKILGYGKHLILPLLQKDIPMSAPRPADVSMDSSKAYSLGYNPLSIRSALEKILKPTAAV